MITEETKGIAQSKIIALHWYCTDYHEGMGSWQYQWLSRGVYTPSPMADCIEDECDFIAQMYYDFLVEKFEG